MALDKVRRSSTSKSKSVRRSETPAKVAKAKSTGSSRPTAESRDRAPAVRRGDRSDAPSGVSIRQLERNPSETDSDPGSATEVTGTQSEAARGVTGGADEDSEFEVLAARQGEESDTETDSGGELEPPDGLVPGAEIPPVPDFTGVRPSEPARENPLTGTEETFEVDGVEYQRTTQPNGDVRTTYEIDGVQYSSTTREDGRSSVFASQSGDNGTHSRTLERDAQGNLISDTTSSVQGHRDPETGEYHSSTRTETLVPDGTRTTTSVDSVDGRPRSYDSRIEDAEGNVREATLDTPEELNAEQFTEQLANFAENGDPSLLSTAISSIDNEQLRQVASTAFASEDGQLLYDFVQATSAASAAGGPGSTSQFAGALHDVLSDENIQLDERYSASLSTLTQSFRDFASSGGDAALGVEMIDRLIGTARNDDNGLSATFAQMALEGTGHVSGGQGLIDAVSGGLAAHYNGFGHAADRVDELNADLSYLTVNYGAFMTEEELAAAQQEFRETHADEYAAFEEQSTGIVANVDNIQRLQELMAQEGEQDYSYFSDAFSFQDLGDTVLERVRQAGGSEQGRAELAAELRDAGRGRDSFVSNLDSLAGDDEGDQDQLAVLRSHIFDAGVSHSAGAASVGDTEAADDMLEGLGISDPNIPTNVITALKQLGKGSADLNDARLQQNLDDALAGADIDSALSSRLRNAGALMGLAGLTANGIDILSGEGNAQTYISTLADGTELGVDVFGDALSRAFSQGGVRTAGRVAGGVGVLLSAVGAVQSLADGDLAGAGLNVAAAVGGALTLSSSAALTGVGAVITVAAIAGQIGLAQYRNVEASNRFESEDTERFVSHALGDANLTQEQQDAITHQLRNADSEGRLTGILFQQAAAQAGIPPRDFLTQIARLDSDAVHDIVTEGHGVDPGDGGVADLSESEVADFLEYVQNEYGVAV